jgi:hypothetical protein
MPSFNDPIVDSGLDLAPSECKSLCNSLPLHPLHEASRVAMYE